MTLLGGIVVFTMSWWVLFFMALPWGARASERPEAGHAASAPEKPRLLLKAAITTVLALLVTFGLGYAIDEGLIDLRPRGTFVESR